MTPETIAEILKKMRGHFVQTKLHDGDFVGATYAHHVLLEYADQIEAACKREAAKLIPGRNILFWDGNGRRQIMEGWVKEGGAK